MSGLKVRDVLLLRKLVEKDDDATLRMMVFSRDF
jgi:hypothetical protein